MPPRDKKEKPIEPVDVSGTQDVIAGATKGEPARSPERPPPPPPPTIGRIVHFTNGHNEVVPAIVARVNDDKTLDLCVLEPNVHGVKPVEPPSPENDEAVTLMRWFWPPRVGG